MKQRDALLQLVENIHPNEGVDQHVLAELLYTASETGVIEPIDSAGAMFIAALVQLASTEDIMNKMEDVCM